MRVLGRPQALVALVALLTFSAGASATGRDIMNSVDVAMDGTYGRMGVPVKVATATEAYPITKYLTRARMAGVMRFALSPEAAAVAAIAGIIISEYNSEDNSGGDVTINNNNYYMGEKFAGTFYAYDINNASLAPYTGPTGTCGGKTYGEASSCAKQAAIDLLTTSSCQFVGPWNEQDLSATLGVGATRYSGAMQNPTTHANCNTAAARVVRSSSSYPTGYSPALATDEQLADAMANYSDPNGMKDLFREAIDADIMRQAAHEPIAISPESLEAINNAVRSGVYSGLTPFEEEMAKWARQHGVSVPDPNSVPETKQPDGTTTSTGSVTVTVNVEPDTPGGTFEAPTLEDVDSFETTTTGFVTGLQVVPIVATWTGITSTVPGGACPVATIEAFGQSYSMMDVACQIWDDHVAPLLAIVFLFVWPFIGLRIIMSA